MKTSLITFALVLACAFTRLALAAPEDIQDVWQKAHYRFTPEVRAAVLDAAKATALAKLSAAGKTLPADFLTWIDSDLTVKTTVYGARQDPTRILLILRSLELDLGEEVVRDEYTQLALAMAVTHAKDADKADLSPRRPLVLIIPGDPCKKVDTHAKDRPLDVDDHIINFLNEHAPIVEEVVVGHKEVLPELTYDGKGVAIPRKPKKEPIKELHARPLRAADVIASAELEREFNDYMKTHGQTVQIDCGGEKRLTWNSRDTAGVNTKGCMEAYKLLLHAYQTKGCLPATRDPAPTLAERCLFLIRNHEYVMPVDKKIAWPIFPLTAPWPVLVMLAQDAQPLRERQDIWERYRDRGEFHGYGEYVGSIAQGPFLQVRRLAPYAFPYGSVQMMLKDGGVCGVMANISVRSHLSLGVPASTAGQPGHCALVKFGYNADQGVYACQGGQYATAGDAGTGVHVPWCFGDGEARRGMVYHQAIAWSINYDVQSYLDSTVAHTFFKQLSAADQQAHGPTLLQTAITLNPYNFLLVDDALDTGTHPGELVAFWQTLKAALPSGKPGCPADGLYNTTIKNKLFGRLASLAVPTDLEPARAIRSFLDAEQCKDQAALATYKVAIDGLPALLAETETAFQAHLASARTDAACGTMSSVLAAAAGKIADKQQRQAWALARWQEIQGKEKYSGHKGHLTTDASVAVLAKLASQRARSDRDQLQTVLDEITQRLETELAGPRTPRNCKLLADVITLTAGQIKDETQKRQWAETLAESIAGKEQYQVQTKKTTQSLRDPCAEAIDQLLTSSARETSKH